jgi:acyl carrier protein phosphodiesterase
MPASCSTSQAITRSRWTGHGIIHCRWSSSAARRRGGAAAGRGIELVRVRRRRAIRAPAFTRLLLSYAEPAGIERALQRTAARLREPAPLLVAAAHWQDAIAPLRSLMPQLLDALRATALEV